MKPYKLSKKGIEITINKMKGQTTLFFILAAMTYFFKIPSYGYFILGLCWIGIIKLLGDKLKENDTRKDK